MKENIAIAAAGTGGHVFPALAVGNILVKNGLRPVWFGTPKGMENQWVDGARYRFHPINMQGVRGKGVVRWILMPFAVLSATLEAKAVLESENVRRVFLCGGYVTVPVGLAARWLKIPIVILEQNAVVGLSNRLLARFAEKIFCGLPSPFSQKQANAEVVGNPVREEMFDVEIPTDMGQADVKRPLRILVLGGSLGAKAINDVLPATLKQLTCLVHVFHQTGERTFKETQAEYDKAGLKGVKLVPFIQNIKEAYDWADIVICRAGALTVSEIAAVGRAAIFIPLPIAVDDHQTKNAKVLVDKGAAKLIPQARLSAASLSEAILALSKEPSVLAQMARTAKSLGMPGAAMKIAKKLVSD